MLQEWLKHPEIQEKSLLVLGYGSNVILPRHFPGVVLLNRIRGIEAVWETDQSVCVSVGAGEVWHDFVVYALSQGWYGLENLAMIPGSVGAAPIQNIGAYGVEVSQFIDSCEVYCIKTASVITLTARDCQFCYRDSVFKRTLKGRFIVLSVRFVLSKKPNVQTHYPRLSSFLRTHLSEVTPESVFHAVCQIRTQRLPAVATTGTVGSFFINPIVDRDFFHHLQSRYTGCHFDHFSLSDQRVKLFAGNLLENAGWKGVGYRSFSLCHVNPIVLTHAGGGDSKTLLAWVNQIKCSVAALFDVVLEVEPEIIVGKP